MKFLLFSLFCSAISFQANSIELLISYVEHPHAEKYKQLLKKTYADIGVTTEFVQLPVARRFIALNKGDIDADVSALELFMQSSPNIVKVQPALSVITIFLACRQSLPCNKGIIDDEHYVYYIDSGILALLKKTINYEPHANVVVLDRVNATMKLLELGRIEYLILSADEQQNLPKAIKQNFNLKIVSKTQIYHHINVRHNSLLNKLEPALAKNLELMRGQYSTK